MPKRHKKQIIPLTLSRTLGVWEVTLLGVGALLGGGIFTLLGHAAGLAGPGLVFSMLLGAAISFLNLNAYIALATTFPEAGGGFVWVKEGLGDIQGFLSGWLSWMATSVACSLYAVSFGIFAAEFLSFFFGPLPGGLALDIWKPIFTILIILIFGLINYRGVLSSGRIGGIISLTLLAILFSYIVFGLKRIITTPEVFQSNFSPLLPFGLAGVIQAAALFYIAFEGSEIQAQTGEEAKNPEKTLKIGMFNSWFIVSLLYALIAFIFVGATKDSLSFPILREERAIIESAKQFLPFGSTLMVIGGLLANIAALNATIYSSSRVLFAMARHGFVWTKLSILHELNKTPYRAILLTIGAILFFAVFLPVKDIASLADILFIALFSQLNLAYLELRRRKPEAKWHYIVPFGPLFPFLAIGIYILLAISLFHVSPVAILFAIIWILLGLVNYFGYAKSQEVTYIEKETIYEHALRFQEKSDYRVIFPIPSEEEWLDLAKVAFALTHEENGDLLALRIREVPPTLPLAAGFHADSEIRILEKVGQLAKEHRINIDTRMIVARTIPEAILEIVKIEQGDLLILGWDGYVNTKGFIFGSKVDVVLHRAKCDLMVVKLRDLEHMKKIFIPVSPDENPNLRFAGKVATALAKWFDGTITVGMVVPEDVKPEETSKYQLILEDRIRELKLKINQSPESKIIPSSYIASAIIKEAQKYDVVLLPAARDKITRVHMGSIPEQVAKHCQKTVIMAKGYRGIAQPFLDYLRSRF